MSARASKRKKRSSVGTGDVEINSNAKTVNDEQDVFDDTIDNINDQSSGSSTIVNASVKLSSETNVVKESAPVTPERKKTQDSYTHTMKRPSVFQLRAQSKNGQLDSHALSQTMRLHNAIRSQTSFLFEATQTMRSDEKRNCVMNVIHAFLTKCGGIALCMVKESDPKKGAFLGSLQRDQLQPTPYGKDVMPHDKNTLATQLGLNYYMKLRREDDIDSVHLVPATITDDARAKAAAQNRTLYTGSYSTPIYIHYPKDEDTSKQFLTEENLKKYAKVCASKLERIMDQKGGKIKNMYRAADPIDFRTWDEEHNSKDNTILLGDIITADGVLEIVKDLFGIESWSALLKNSEIMDLYFGTEQLRDEVVKIKGGRKDDFDAPGFHRGSEETVEQKRAILEQMEAEKKKQLEDEDKFLASMRR